MFLDELTPIVKTLVAEPIAFLGGFAAGVFQVNLNEDPLKSWLAQNPTDASANTTTPSVDNTKGPKTISID
jgi:hypothetical protein